MSETVEDAAINPESSKPIVLMRAGKVEAVVDQAQDALMKNGCTIYQRGGELIRPIKLDAPQVGKQGEARPLLRPAGATVLVPVKEAWLIEQMNRSAEWYVLRRKDGKLVKSLADPKPVYAKTLMSREGEWAFPTLRGVVNSPTLALDGRIIQEPGYDDESGLLVDCAPGSFPKVPKKPTKDQAVEAMKFFTYPFRAYPFVNPAAKAVAMSALLTSLIRINLRTSPLHGMDSPTPANGKSLMAECAGVLSTGVIPPAMSQGKTEEEDEKRLSTVLHAGDSVIHIDNCGHHLQGDFLCSMLSQEFVQARILGLSARRILPSTALVIASGNNLTFAGDVSRRAVTCRIDSKTERPEERKFDWNPREDIKKDRAKFVIAGLTILLAYRVAGNPENLKPMGSFDDWEWVRGALVWIGEGDPADTRVSVQSGDPQREEMSEIAELWEKAFKSRRVRVSDIETSYTSVEDVALLRARLVDIVCRGTWSGRSVGRWLMRWKDRIVGGRYFTCTEDQSSGHLWELKTGQAGLF